MSELKEYEVRIGRKLYQTLPPIVYVVADDHQPKLLNDKVYLKSEADKVIEDLKSMNKHLGRLDIIMASETIKYLEERHAKEVKRLSMEIAELKAENESLKASISKFTAKFQTLSVAINPSLKEEPTKVEEESFDRYGGYTNGIGEE